MEIIVKKFGGTSVQSVEFIEGVANLIAKEYKKNKIVVVVSAMAGVTNQLVNYVQNIKSPVENAELKEYDVVVSAGEQITIGLLALALIKIGLKAKSYLGWQLPILTDCDYADGKILDINTKPLLNDIALGYIPIIAGFQGVYQNSIVTLGRGGSDTTATALAIALNAKRCDIYTDVAGVFTADPKIVKNAKKIDELSHKQMLHMAKLGSKVFHHRAASLALHYNKLIRILRTFGKNKGTIIKQKDIINHMENIKFTAVCSKDHIIMITLSQLSKVEFINITSNFAENKIVIEHFIKENNLAEHNCYNKITFLIQQEFEDRALNTLMKLKIQPLQIHIKQNLAKVSVIGHRVNEAEAISSMLKAIEGDKIIMMFSLETTISIIIYQDDLVNIVQTLHSKLGLAD